MRAYYLAIHIAAIKNPKAKEWIEGRRNEGIKDLKKEGTNKLTPSSLHSDRIWMHCSSLGEFEQGKPILEALRKKISRCFYNTYFFFTIGL